MNRKEDESTTNIYEPLFCKKCGEDLLGAALGNCVFAQTTDWAVLPRYVDVYWVCKGRCDKLVQADLRVKNLRAPWIDLNELTNPLIHKSWEVATSRRIDLGEYSEAATAKISKLLRTMAPIADRQPTEQDIGQYRLLRQLNGL